MSPNTFDLNLLRIFDALHRDRSVSRAADALGLSQPAVSNALGRLRAQLGDPLFVRTRSGMEPTALALALRGPIQASLAQIRAALTQNLAFDPLGCTQTFTLIMTDVGEAFLLPPLLRQLSHQAPNMRLNVIELSSVNHEAHLDSGDADVAIGSLSLSDSFRSDHLRNGTYLALFAADNPLLAQIGDETSLSMAAYFAAEHIAVTPRGQTGNPVDDVLSRIGLRRNILVSIPHAMALAAVLPQSRFVATVPDACVFSLSRDQRLRWARLPFDMGCNDIRFWWHKRHDSDPAHAWLRSVIRTLSIDRPADESLADADRLRAEPFVAR